MTIKINFIKNQNLKRIFTFKNMSHILNKPLKKLQVIIQMLRRNIIYNNIIIIHHFINKKQKNLNMILKIILLNNLYNFINN